ncbi:MAG: hypothetical protein VCF08_07630 [Alphaproteobacteria bacterium]
MDVGAEFRLGGFPGDFNGVSSGFGGGNGGLGRFVGFTHHVFSGFGGLAGMDESAPDQVYARASYSERNPASDGQLLREFGHDLLSGEITAGNMAKLILGFCVG